MVQPATSPRMVYEVTYGADIFAAKPPLGAEQQAVEDELLKTSTIEFWKKSAQENGISDRKSLMSGKEDADQTVELDFFCGARRYVAPLFQRG